MISAIPYQKTEKPKRLRDQFREWLVFHHYSPRTADAYIARVLDFVMWSGRRDPMTMGGAEVNAFLSHLANETTTIYLHVAQPPQKRIKSPLEGLG